VNERVRGCRELFRLAAVRARSLANHASQRFFPLGSRRSRHGFKSRWGRQQIKR
jgi:hypothetical protein